MKSSVFWARSSGSRYFTLQRLFGTGRLFRRAIFYFFKKSTLFSFPPRRTRLVSTLVQPRQYLRYSILFLKTEQRRHFKITMPATPLLYKRFFTVHQVSLKTKRIRKRKKNLLSFTFYFLFFSLFPIQSKVLRKKIFGRMLFWFSTSHFRSLYRNRNRDIPSRFYRCLKRKTVEKYWKSIALKEYDIYKRNRTHFRLK